eukprot:COSAG01_NODE_1382_length_10521_cov_61.545001_7_plen_145_part_00
MEDLEQHEVQAAILALRRERQRSARLTAALEAEADALAEEDWRELRLSHAVTPQVSRSCARIGSPCLRNCVHGASIGGRLPELGDRADGSGCTCGVGEAHSVATEVCGAAGLHPAELGVLLRATDVLWLEMGPRPQQRAGVGGA